MARDKQATQLFNKRLSHFRNLVGCSRRRLSRLFVFCGFLADVFIDTLLAQPLTSGSISGSLLYTVVGHILLAFAT